MRVLCSTTAGDGHFGPLRVLARACAAAGHEVLVAAPASYAAAVGRSGLEHGPFADAPADRMSAVLRSLPSLERDRANAVVMAEVFGRLDAQAALPGLAAVVDRWRPDVVLRDPAELGSLAAAEAAGVPSAEVAIGVAGLMDWGRTHLGDALAELDSLAGLPAGHLLRASASTPVFTMVPESMERAAGVPEMVAAPDPPPERRVVRFRDDGDPGPGRLPAAWGDPEAPLVYVTFGTVAGGLGHLRDVFETALDGLADLPVRVLLTTGHAGGVVLDHVPSNAHVERFWPQEDVMPLATAMVGHGGFGTTMTALAAGVPQVVVPLFTTDQWLNAEAVAALGAGTCLRGGPAAAAEVGPAVAALLADPTARRAAVDVAAEISSLPGPSAVVAEVDRLVEEGFSPAAG